jgi:hypothetical protein
MHAPLGAEDLGSLFPHRTTPKYGQTRPADALGGNSLTLFIGTLRQGEWEASATTLRQLATAKAAHNYPIINHARARGLLHKLRFRLLSVMVRSDDTVMPTIFVKHASPNPHNANHATHASPSNKPHAAPPRTTARPSASSWAPPPPPATPPTPHWAPRGCGTSRRGCWRRGRRRRGWRRSGARCRCVWWGVGVGGRRLNGLMWC